MYARVWRARGGTEPRGRRGRDGGREEGKGRREEEGGERKEEVGRKGARGSREAVEGGNRQEIEEESSKSRITKKNERLAQPGSISLGCHELLGYRVRNGKGSTAML